MCKRGKEVQDLSELLERLAELIKQLQQAQLGKNLTSKFDFVGPDGRWL